MIPNDQYWFRSARAWLGILPSLKKRETQPVFSRGGGFGR
jgi:hypothetical protein